MNNISISQINITQKQLNGWAGTAFDPSKLDMYGLEKNTMNNTVIKSLKHLLSRKEVDVPVNWIGEHKQRLPPQKLPNFVRPQSGRNKIEIL